MQTAHSLLDIIQIKNTEMLKNLLTTADKRKLCHSAKSRINCFVNNTKSLEISLIYNFQLKQYYP